MNHDERIDAMCAAWLRAFGSHHEWMEAAWAAAGIEAMVREAALQMAGMCVAEFAPTIEMPSTMLIERADAIVERVMQGER